MPAKKNTRISPALDARQRKRSQQSAPKNKRFASRSQTDKVFVPGASNWRQTFKSWFGQQALALIFFVCIGLSSILAVQLLAARSNQPSFFKFEVIAQRVGEVRTMLSNAWTSLAGNLELEAEAQILANDRSAQEESSTKVADEASSIAIQVSASYQYLDRSDIQAIIEPELQQDFMKLSLSAIKNSLESHPWIASATVQRKWPNELKIRVVEEEPIAQWSDQGYLNRYGQLFLTEPKPDLVLPQLYFSDRYDSSKAKHYAELTATLAQFELKLIRLDVDPTGLHRLSVRAYTDYSERATKNQQIFTIVAEDASLLERLERFGQIYQQALQDSAKALAQVDLRYQRGLAVRWHTDTIQNSTELASLEIDSDPTKSAADKL